MLDKIFYKYTIGFKFDYTSSQSKISPLPYRERYHFFQRLSEKYNLSIYCSNFQNVDLMYRMRLISAVEACTHQIMTTLPFLITTNTKRLAMRIV